MLGEAENALLQNASATGGLRGGNTQSALSELRPALLTSLIEQSYSRAGDLAGYGQLGRANISNAYNNYADQNISGYNDYRQNQLFNNTQYVSGIRDHVDNLQGFDYDLGRVLAGQSLGHGNRRTGYLGAGVGLGKLGGDILKDIFEKEEKE